MTLTLESENNTRGQRALLGSPPSIQVGWNFCKPAGYFTGLGAFLLSCVGTKLALKAKQREAGVHLYLCLALSVSHDISFPISRHSTPQQAVRMQSELVPVWKGTQKGLL